MTKLRHRGRAMSIKAFCPAGASNIFMKQKSSCTTMRKIRLRHRHVAKIANHEADDTCLAPKTCPTMIRARRNERREKHDTKGDQAHLAKQGGHGYSCNEKTWISAIKLTTRRHRVDILENRTQIGHDAHTIIKM